jgi:VWFA-related protein
MRGWLTAAFILGVSVALGAQQPTFRSGTQTVPLYITVTDSAGRLVPNLTKDDFTVLDNGIPQEISVFDNTVRPITSVVMLDTSGSMTLNLDLMKAAAEQFIIRLLPEDKAMVGAFNNKVEFASAGFTNDRDDLAHAIRELDYGNATRLFPRLAQLAERRRPA